MPVHLRQDVGLQGGGLGLDLSRAGEQRGGRCLVGQAGGVDADVEVGAAHGRQGGQGGYAGLPFRAISRASGRAFSEASIVLSGTEAA